MGITENTHRYQYVILTSIYTVQLVGTYVCSVTDDGQHCVSSQVRAINIRAIPAAGNKRILTVLWTESECNISHARVLGVVETGFPAGQISHKPPNLLAFQTDFGDFITLPTMTMATIAAW